MNQLEFHIALKTIKNTKTIKDLKSIIRKYIFTLPIAHYSTIRPKDAEEHYFNYRLLSTALISYSSKTKVKLPDFVYAGYTSVQQKLFSYMFTQPCTDYDKFVQTFTDTPLLVVRDTTGEILINYSELVQDKYCPIQGLQINISVNGYYGYLGNTNNSSYLTPKLTNKIFLLEHLLKNLKNPDKTKYVFITKMINEYYNNPIELDAIVNQVIDTLDTISIIKSKLETNNELSKIHAT